MTGANPQSQVPGGWSKDSPAVEQNNPVDEAQQSVPRTEGTVSESGDIVDSSGKAIGKLPESKDPKELAGNTVTTAGEIVNDSGEVLGKVADQATGDNDNDNEEAESEYTTKAVEEGDSSSGYNLLGKTKGMFGFGGSQKAKEEGDEAGDTAGDAAGDAAGDVAAAVKQSTEDAKDDANDQVEEGKDAAPVNLEDNDKSVEERAQDAGDDAQKTLDSKDDAAEDVKDKAEETTDDAQKTAEDATEGDKPVDTGDVEKTGEDVEKTAEDATEGDKPVDTENLEDKPAEAQEGLEEKSAEAQEALEGDKPAEEQQEGEEPKEGEEGDKPVDYSVLKGTKVNKAGNLVNDKGELIGRVVEGDVKQLIGKRADENGDIWNDSGKKVGRGEPHSDAEREGNKTFAPFENFPDAVVEADGKVVFEGKQVGEVVEGDPKKLKGSKVDEDGDILDRNGNVVGKAEPWDEPEEIPEEEKDNSALAGKRVNKAGNVVSSSGEIYGRVIEGEVSKMVGRMCDKDGNIRSESGDIIGKAELIPEGEREGHKEGPFAELSGCTVAKDGTIVTPSGDIVGRLTQGDGKTLFGRKVDEDGDVVDSNGNTLGKAERWEPEEEEKKKGPMAGRKVNRDGNVLDDDGNIMGKLISGDAVVCAGKEIDDDGDVINSKGQSIGHVALLEDIPQEAEPEESAEDKAKREQAEKDQEEAEKDRKLAGQLSGSIEQSLDKVRPICKMITDKIERAERTPKEELDEEELVKQVKPLIEEGGKILTETNGVIRGLDPDGRIQRNAKHKAGTKEATPEEHHLAEVLKELTGTVTSTIDKAKSMIEDMPHAKKELNPLWGLLSEPLGQIIAAVGLLLNGVLGILGRLLGGLGLGNILEGLLGSLGLDKVLDGLGLGSITGSLTGKK